MTKLQIPKKLQTPSSKATFARRRLKFEVWSLGFLWNLELGIWSL
jgi:hypothetical protein